MKYKVSELEGVELDASVARAEGVEVEWSFGRCWRKPVPGVARETYEPSRDWRDGGPIIERERITVGPAANGKGWWAGEPRHHKNDGYGPTPLIAAMRAYVASKFGEEVELP